MFVDLGLGLYALLACLGLFIRPGLIDSTSSLVALHCWIAGYLLLVFKVSYDFVFSDSPLLPVPFRFIALGVIFVNFIMQLTGGAHSNFWSAYYLFAVVFAALSRLPQAALMVLAILSVELFSLLITRQFDAARWQTYAGFGLSLAGISLATSYIMGYVLKKADQAKDAFKRLEEKANAVDPLAEPAKLESLMPESRQAANLRTARDREASFKGLLDMMFLIVPAHTYALFVKERREGSERLVLRACRTESQGKDDVIPVGTALEPSAGKTGIDLCAERHTAHYLPDLTADSVNFLGYYGRDVKNIPVRSAMLIPILSTDQENVVAVLAVDKVTTDSFSSETQEMLKRFSAFFLEVIENTQLSLDLKTRGDHFGALHDISTDLNSSLLFSEIIAKVIPQINKIVPFDHCACMLKTELEGKTVLQLTALDGYSPEMAGRTFAIEESAIIHRLYQDWQNRPPHDQSRDTTVYYKRSYGEGVKEIGIFPFKELHLPIQSLYARLLVPNDKFIGVFLLASRRRDAFSEYHREYLLDTLMNQIGHVADNSLLHKKIDDLARTDGLTGLLNHRTFMEMLNAKYRELERTPRPFSILLMDIDRFKLVNDKYGHPIGDIAIKAVGRILQDTIRGTDFVARYGGEEFAVGMVETDRKGAELMAERVRSLMEKTVVTRVSDGELKCTLSIGVVSFPEDTDDRAGLVAMADEALYHAKRNGRNRVSLYRDALKEPAQTVQP
jgi:diguanylate cyclase (GGDEF)-like protein